MPPDLAALVPNLPTWAQPLAYVLVFGFGVGVMILNHRAGRAKSEGEAEHFDPDDLLEASPIRQFLEDVSTIADNAKLQTEALKTISAAATASAKLIEDDFDERRVHREVERRLDQERRLREGRGQSAPGWGS